MPWKLMENICCDKSADFMGSGVVFSEWPFNLKRASLFLRSLESVQNWKFCKMSLFLARSRFEYCASWASPKKLARHWSLGPSLEMSPKFGKLASTSPCKWSIFKLIHYFFPFPCFIYLHLIQFYVRLNKITFLYVSIIENIRSKAL